MPSHGQQAQYEGHYSLQLQQQAILVVSPAAFWFYDRMCGKLGLDGASKCLMLVFLRLVCTAACACSLSLRSRMFHPLANPAVRVAITDCSPLWLKTCHWHVFLTRRASRREPLVYPAACPLFCCLLRIATRKTTKGSLREGAGFAKGLKSHERRLRENARAALPAVLQSRQPSTSYPAKSQFVKQTPHSSAIGFGATLHDAPSHYVCPAP